MSRERDLMFCCLGNGVTVCDRSRMRHGDYETVAHIDPCGAYKLYSEELPEAAVKQINAHALRMVKDFKRAFTLLGRVGALDMMYSSMNIKQLLSKGRLGDLTVEQMYALYIENTCENRHYVMPREDV